MPPNEVFVYMGERGESPPQNVVRVRVDPSVTSIPAHAFWGSKKLTEVELCEDLVEIGEKSFMWCDQSITKINIPTSLRRVCDYAFKFSLRCPIRLHDGIESIGQWAFLYCIFTNFRVPLLITVIPEGLLHACRSLFSVELSEDVSEIGYYAFEFCYCLRNVAFPPDVVFGGDTFIEEGIAPNAIFIEEDDDDNEMELRTDLQRLFGLESRIIFALQHRFDDLPIHSIVYYQSYYQGVLERLIAAINMRSGQRRSLCIKLDPTGNQQDCLGMTPLHILACSSVHDLQLYRQIVEKYPANLVTEDRWGALPLLYAFWGAAPAEIIQFLLDSYQSLYPDHVFNWTMMVETMGRCDTPKESIENLLRVKEMHFPEQPLDWEYLLDKFAMPLHIPFPRAPFQERMRFLFKCGLSSRVEALPFRVWRDHIEKMIQTANFQYGRDNSTILRTIQEKLALFEYKLPELEEATTILELALWKTRLDESVHKRETTHRPTKVKPDVSDIRQQCRATCEADVIIRLVLPFLITTVDEE
jgi:hypothetical protein